MTAIGEYAFHSCEDVVSITIPDSVTTIGKYAFLECSHLDNVIIPESITAVSNYLFNKCNRLTSVTIPESVTSIGKYAFYGCNKLASVIFEVTAGWDVNGKIMASSDIENSETAATYLKDTYARYTWQHR